MFNELSSNGLDVQVRMRQEAIRREIAVRHLLASIERQARPARRPWPRLYARKGRALSTS